MQLDREILVMALSTAEAQRAKLDEHISALRAAIGERTPSQPRKRRKLSAAGRKAIADAAKKRWAKLKGTKPKQRRQAQEIPVEEP
jgi:hypothetical protein